MTTLTSCPQCSSFNPPQTKACLNCDTLLQVNPPSIVSRVLKTAGIVAISLNLTACYGAMDLPYCNDEDADGFCDFEDCNDQNPEVDTGENCDRSSAPSIAGEIPLN